MNFQEFVRTRRSVRRFRKGKIPETKLLSILDSARWAPSYRNSQPWNLLVLSMASENMMLMAHELGLGSSFIDVTYSRISRYFEKDKIYERYGIPDGMEIFSIIVFGIPDEIPRVPHRKSLSEIVHYGGW